MILRKLRFIFLFGIALIFVCCSEYQKLLNNDDASKKYRSAEEYYKKGEFRKANRLIEQIIPKEFIKNNKILKEYWTTNKK